MLCPTIKTGDIIAFSGNSFISTLIGLFTKSPISHIAISIGNNKIIEAVMDEKDSSVRIASVEERIQNYKGTMALLPLKNRELLKENELLAFLFANKDKPYDLPSLIEMGLGLVFNKYKNKVKEDLKMFFCSELASAALHKGNILPHINFSAVTPKDLCSFNIYEDKFFNLKTKEISNFLFNKIDPLEWSKNNN